MAKKKNVFKEIWKLFWAKNENKNIWKVPVMNEKKVAQSIYDTGISIAEQNRKYHRIHHIFKYRFWVPVLLLSKRFLGRFMTKEIKPLPWNKDIKLFFDSWEESIREWALVYLRNQPVKQDRRLKTWEKKIKEHGSCTNLRTMKEIGQTIVLMDTAYREFLNIFCHRFYTNYHNAHKNQKNRTHLMFAGEISRQYYFTIFPQIQNGQLNLIPADTKSGYHIGRNELKKVLGKIKEAATEHRKGKSSEYKKGMAYMQSLMTNKFKPYHYEHPNAITGDNLPSKDNPQA